MNAAAQRRLTLPLAVLALLLGALLLALLSGTGRSVRWDPPYPVASLPQAAAVQLPPPRPLEQFAEVWQQPLFAPDRKPVHFVSSNQSHSGDVSLTGVILTPSLHMALLRGQSGGEFRVREGESLPGGGATLVELRPRSAVLENDGSRIELQLPAGAPIDVHQGETGTALQDPPRSSIVPVQDIPGPMAGSPLAPSPVVHSSVTDSSNSPARDQEAQQRNERIQQRKDAMQRRRAAQQGEH